jgi:hypothetical protein
VSFISLAAVLGLITGICLGGFALLLAAPAYGAETKGGASIPRPAGKLRNGRRKGERLAGPQRYVPLAFLS